MVLDPTIKSDDTGIHKVVFSVVHRGAGFVEVHVIGTERVLKACQVETDSFISHHDTGTGVFEQKEGNITWRCYYAKDKVRKAKAPIKIASAKITFKDNSSVVLNGDEIDDNFIVGYANADKTGSNARVMIRFKDGKKYPTSTVYYSKGYIVMVKQ